MDEIIHDRDDACIVLPECCKIMSFCITTLIFQHLAIRITDTVTKLDL